MCINFEISMENAEKYERENNWSEALNIYNKLLLKEPNKVNILEKVGWCFSRLNKYNDAVEIFQKLSNLEPKKAKWDYMVGYQYYSMKEWDKAIEFFRLSLSKYPEYFIVKYRLGYALTQISGKIQRLKSPNYLEAYKLFNECESLWDSMPEGDKNRERQHYADVCFQKSKILIERSEWEEAIDSIKKSIKIDKNNTDYFYILSKALCGKGEYEEALRVIPNSSKYYINELKAKIYSQLNDIDRSIDLYTLILKSRKRDYLYRQLGEEYVKKNDLPNAFINIQKAIKLGSKNHTNYFALGNLYYKAGLLISAKSELEKAHGIKQKEYNCDYIEALNLINEVNDQIKLNNIKTDDIKILNSLKKCLENKNDEIIQGKVKKYKAERGFGFIQSRDKDVYFHISEVYKPHQKNLCEGINITFYIQESPKGLIAKDIRIIENQ